MSTKLFYRILVVEDEPPILDNLVEKLESTDLPVRVVGTAADGEQALELVKRLQPDILFTDIKMPIMDGLTLIEEARKHLPSLRTVIISGYSDFEYAQRAIQYGVTDYLLKPVRLSELKKVVHRLCDSLTDLRIAHERQVIAAQLNGSENESLPSDFADESFTIYLICLGSMYDRCYEALDRDALAGYWELADLPELLRPYATAQKRWWMVSEKFPNCRMLITTARGQQSDRMIYEEMLRRLLGKTSVTVCGIGTPIAFTDIWSSAQRLRELLAKQLIPGVSQFLISDSPASKELFFPAQQQLLNSLLTACRPGQLQPFTEVLREFLVACRTGRVTQTYLEQGLLRIAEELGATAADDIDTATLGNDLLHTVASAAAAEPMYTALQALLRDAAAQGYRLNAGTQELAVRIHRYIDEHYLEPITMETVAGVFHFSCSYITRIFKKEYDTPPFRYLLGLRINEAKRLIKQSDSINISLIAQSVGYEDQHYFSRIFKNVTGLSPSEYKKRSHPSIE